MDYSPSTSMPIRRAKAGHGPCQSIELSIVHIDVKIGQKSPLWPQPLDPFQSPVEMAWSDAGETAWHRRSALGPAMTSKPRPTASRHRCVGHPAEAQPRTVPCMSCRTARRQARENGRQSRDDDRLDCRSRCLPPRSNSGSVAADLMCCASWPIALRSHMRSCCNAPHCFEAEGNGFYNPIYRHHEIVGHLGRRPAVVPFARTWHVPSVACASAGGLRHDVVTLSTRPSRHAGPRC